MKPNAIKRRSQAQKILDAVTFPLRAITLFYDDKWRLSSLQTERFDYVARKVRGHTLDVGCGPHNRFINQFLNKNGKGIDVFAYDGLTEEHIVDDITQFPFDDAVFDSITFIANINHIPESMRDLELAEAYRCLKPNGNVVVTMGNPLAEIIVHKVVYLYDKLLNTRLDVDTERGMDEEEAYFLKDSEIVERLERAGFANVKKQFFLTQWGLNHLFEGWKA